jgi:hypothetical protein
MGIDPRLTASGSIALRICSAALLSGHVWGRAWDGLKCVSRALPLSSSESGKVMLRFDGTPALESAWMGIIH